MNRFRKHAHDSIALAAALTSALSCVAQNPIVQTIFTADPAPLVHEGTLYLYTGHDEEDAPDDRFVMHDYQCFTTTDMVNWTHHGAVFDIRKVFSWSGGDANAAQCVERNGKFYYYVSTADKTHPGVALGVAVSESPFGPFKDALGRALVTNDQTTYAPHSWDDLDPTVFIDDDGRALLSWGNNACYFAELNDDMISLKGGISHVALTKEAFGPDYEEAPWLSKRHDQYYLLYASSIPESICYATSKSPAGPWAYGGLVMDVQKGNGSNHPGLIDYQGHSYFFYHTAALPRGCDHRRSVSIEQFSYAADGRIPEIALTQAGIIQGVAKLNPYAKTEAETIAWSSGIKTARTDDAGVYVTAVDHGDYVKVRDVDFGTKGATKFSARVASATNGGHIELRLDTPSGPLIGTLEVRSSGAWEKWETHSCSVTAATGVHDLYLKFTGGNGPLLNFDWWQFE